MAAAAAAPSSGAGAAAESREVAEVRTWELPERVETWVCEFVRQRLVVEYTRAEARDDGDDDDPSALGRAAFPRAFDGREVNHQALVEVSRTDGADKVTEREVKIGLLKLKSFNLPVVPPGLGEHALLRRSVVSLDLGCNRLTELDVGLAALTRLQLFRAYSNRLKRIPGELLAAWPDLQDLGLGNNRDLEELPAEIGLCPRLLELALGTTSVKSLPVELGNCRRLKYLYLNATKVTELPPSLSRCRELERLAVKTEAMTFPPASLFEEHPSDVPAILAWLAEHDTVMVKAARP